MANQSQQSSLLGKIAAYTEILAKDPKSTIFVSLSEAYRKMGMLDDARKVAESGLVYHADFTPAHIVLARILCQQGDYTGSSHHFERSLELDGASLAALVGYARLNILLGQEDRARDLLLEARKQSPADPIINKLLLSLPEKTQLPEAENQAVPLDVDAVVAPEVTPVQPTLASATLADLYLKQGLEQQALGMYRQLSEQDPNNLVLRRKIRDLEDRLAAPSSPEESVVSNLQAVENPEPDTEQDASFVTAETDIVSGAPLEFSAPADSEVVEPLTAVFSDQSDESADGTMAVNERAINRLTQWLDSIQQRRRDV